jgi:hypothetical protein
MVDEDDVFDIGTIHCRAPLLYAQNFMQIKRRCFQEQANTREKRRGLKTFGMMSQQTEKTRRMIDDLAAVWVSHSLSVA